ncbi:MAG: 3D domain-containing protein [Patescibacteria group bacterium]
MQNSLKEIGKHQIWTAILITTLLIGVFPFLQHWLFADADLGDPSPALPELTILRENSLAYISSPNNPDPPVVDRMNVLITAYSSTPWETDEDPFITAAGTAVRDGVIANNLFPFGTKIKIPQLYGDKIFIVEDRMNMRMGNYQFDIWFSNTQEAKNFGVKRVYVEILES